MGDQESYKEKERYDRIRAVSTFGYDISWENLVDKKITVAGVGGLGMVAADMFARCGVGTLFLFDLDTVERVNLNRLGVSAFNPNWRIIRRTLYRPIWSPPIISCFTILRDP